MAIRADDVSARQKLQGFFSLTHNHLERQSHLLDHSSKPNRELDNPAMTTGQKRRWHGLFCLPMTIYNSFCVAQQFD
jgi:hypothetical protein